jgi:hypothetical protein
MFRKILLLVSLVLTAHASRAAIDLTPVVTEYVGEGILYHQIVFKQPKGSITMELPNQWSCTGSGDRVRLTPPPAKAFAEGVITSSPLHAPQPLDEAVIAAFKQQVLASVPPGSQAVTLMAEIENSIRLDGNPGFEFVIFYKLLGQTFRRNAVLVHMPDTRLVFQFSAPEKDFDALGKTFRHAFATMQWVQPSSAKSLAQSDQPRAIAGRQ